MGVGTMPAAHATALTTCPQPSAVPRTGRRRVPLTAAAHRRLRRRAKAGVFRQSQQHGQEQVHVLAGPIQRGVQLAEEWDQLRRRRAPTRR